MDINELKHTIILIEDGKLMLKNERVNRTYSLRKLSKRLSKASKEELLDYNITSSHYGIHWNKIDEDISIAALLNEPEEEYKRKK